MTRPRPTRHLPAAALVATALVLAVPAGAAAQLPPASGGMTLRVLGAQQLGAQTVAPVGHTIRLRGLISPAVEGELVTVRVNIGPRRVLLVRRTVERAGGYGAFEVEFPVRRVGIIKASALHDASPQQGRLAATSRTVSSFVPAAGRGARGLRVRFLQSRLALEGYAVNRTGVYDEATARAVLAFRKANVMARVQSPASRAIFLKLAVGQGGFPVRYRTHGRHVEADLGRQVLALIEPGGRVFRTYHMSSGAPSTPTVLGSFRFYLKTPGTNSKGMVHSNYFIGGYAIHGYKSVPTHPASHGCLRVPISNARFIFRWIRNGDRIDVYYRRPGQRKPPVRRDAGP
jgi:hypothetical protein